MQQGDERKAEKGACGESKRQRHGHEAAGLLLFMVIHKRAGLHHGAAAQVPVREAKQEMDNEVQQVAVEETALPVDVAADEVDGQEEEPGYGVDQEVLARHDPVDVAAHESARKVAGVPDEQRKGNVDLGRKQDGGLGGVERQNVL